jgi:serine protease Do
MKKIGLIAGLSFLVGALFFALTFGYLQEKGRQGVVLAPAAAQAETAVQDRTDEAPKFTEGRFSFAPVVKKVKAAVVKVTSESLVDRRRSRFHDDFLDRFFNTPRGNRGRGERERVSGTGSGFFISADGYILTNNHVVQNAIKIKITDINKKEYVAKKIGVDPKTDLALLKIKGSGFPYIQLGDSDALEVGEWVLAIGNPLGQDLSVTSGIVSAKGRQLSGLEVDYQNFIQTDAAINQGNSGGPLLNMEGKAIGINSAILSTSGGSIGIGFAIPANMANKVIADLKREGRVIRGYIGVSILEIADSEAEQYDLPSGGILVMKVEDGLPAQKAGLEKYDLIVGINGKKVKTSAELRTIIANHDPGESLRLTFFRDGKKKSLQVKVIEAPDSLTIRSDDNEGGKLIELGMTLTDNNRDYARQNDLDTSEGIVITKVDRGGVADQHNLRAGDIILGVNRTTIVSVRQFRRIMAEKSGSRVFLSINRNGRESFIRFSVPD